MAASLVRHGADRVIAMLAPVTDPYATALARHLYHELAARPGLTAGPGADRGPGISPRKTAALTRWTGGRRRSMGCRCCWRRAGTAR